MVTASSSLTHEPVTIWVAAGVLLKGERVLLAQRHADDTLGGLWEFPGGKIEPGEAPREALRRELREELGIDVRVGEVLELCFERGPGPAIALVFFAVHLREDSPQPTAVDVADWRWVLPQDIVDEELTPGDRIMADRLRQKR